MLLLLLLLLLDEQKQVRVVAAAAAAVVADGSPRRDGGGPPPAAAASAAVGGGGGRGCVLHDADGVDRDRVAPPVVDGGDGCGVDVVLGDGRGHGLDRRLFHCALLLLTQAAVAAAVVVVCVVLVYGRVLLLLPLCRVGAAPLPQVQVGPRLRRRRVRELEAVGPEGTADRRRGRGGCRGGVAGAAVALLLLLYDLLGVGGLLEDVARGAGDGGAELGRLHAEGARTLLGAV